MKNIFKQQVGGGVNRTKAGTGAIGLFLVLLALLMVFPFFYAVMQSLKGYSEIFAFPPRIIPQHPTFENYRELGYLTATMSVPFSRYVFNSVFVSLFGTLIYVLIASMGAYALAFSKRKEMKVINSLIVNALLFTSPVTAMAQYLIISKLGMLNTHWAIILPSLAAPLGIFLMRQFMCQMVPSAMIEAARIDGSGEMRILFKIILPIVKPALATLVLFTFQGLWNSTGSNFIYDEAFKVLPTVMGELVMGGMSRAGAGAASAVILMLPPIVIFFFTQSKVLETMASSGIKE